MTTMQQPVESAAPDAIQQEAAAATTGRGFAKRLVIGVLLVLLLIAGTYALGWFNAYRLSGRFIEEADASYAEGDYMVALVGQESYDAEAEQYVKTGGYIDVERIWSHRYSWPTPGVVEQAAQRSDEIIYDRLTAAQAEQYIQRNIGRQVPYFSTIYLRLGELYLEEGDEMAAREIFESIPELFPREPTMIEEAQKRLDQMED